MPSDHERRSETLSNKILKFWPILFAIATFIAAVTTVENKMTEIETRGLSNESRGIATDLQVASLKTAVSMIKDDTDRLVNELLDKK